MIRVFLADDHAIVREGLRAHIDEEPDLTVVGEASDGLEVLRRAETETWDLLVLDLSLPGCSGIDVLRKLRASRPELPIIVFSMYPEDQHGLQLLREGAAAYLSKGRTVAEILEAIRKVAHGERYVTSEVARSVLAGGEPRAPHEQLSRREHEIFLLIAQGKTPSDIAVQLDIGPSTVSTYLARIREKLGVKSNGEMVQYAYRHRVLGE